MLLYWLFKSVVNKGRGTLLGWLASVLWASSYHHPFNISESNITALSYMEAGNDVTSEIATNSRVSSSIDYCDRKYL